MLALSEASYVAITLGVLTLIGTIVAAWLSRDARRQATAAKEQATATNTAVNHVDPNEPALKDRVAAIEGKVDLLVKWLKPDNHTP